MENNQKETNINISSTWTNQLAQHLLEIGARLQQCREGFVTLHDEWGVPEEERQKENIQMQVKTLGIVNSKFEIFLIQAQSLIPPKKYQKYKHTIKLITLNRKTLKLIDTAPNHRDKSVIIKNTSQVFDRMLNELYEMYEAIVSELSDFLMLNESGGEEWKM